MMFVFHTDCLGALKFTRITDERDQWQIEGIMHRRDQIDKEVKMLERERKKRWWRKD